MERMPRLVAPAQPCRKTHPFLRHRRYDAVDRLPERTRRGGWIAQGSIEIIERGEQPALRRNINLAAETAKVIRGHRKCSPVRAPVCSRRRTLQRRRRAHKIDIGRIGVRKVNLLAVQRRAVSGVHAMWYARQNSYRGQHACREQTITIRKCMRSIRWHNSMHLQCVGDALYAPFLTIRCQPRGMGS